MPFFRTTNNIFVDSQEYFNPNWMDSDKLVLPPKNNWDYSRELQIEDVNIWEVIHEQGVGLGLYASWDPYAEFYMITKQFHKITPNQIEFFYGANASMIAYNRAKELGMPVELNTHWVEPEDMWLYQPKEILDLIL